MTEQLEIEVKRYEAELRAMEGAEVKIQDEAGLEKAKMWFKSIRALRKTIEEKEQEATGPAKEFIERVKSQTRPLVDSCKRWEAVIKKEMDGYLLELAKRRKEEEKVVVEAIRAGDVTGAIQKLEAIEKPTGVQERRIKELKIENENLIPDEYWQLDEVKIRKDLLAGKEVPGAILTEKIISIVK